MIIALISIISIIVISAVGSLVYLAVPFPVDDVAQDILNNNQNVVSDGDITTVKGENPNSAIIFYPGAKVESIAYLPLFEKISNQTGLTCFLLDMPFNLAVLDSVAAAEIISSFPEIENWYMAGHSLGGSMASDFASNNPDIINGVIVMGAYVYGDFPTENSLTLYGTFNASIGERIEYTDNIVVIEGGNHAQFGNYGKQPGDPEATISAQHQQQITADSVYDFLFSQGVVE